MSRAPRIQIGGAGGAPSNNFIRSLRVAPEPYYLIGACATPSDLFLADTDEKHVTLPASHRDYERSFLGLLARTRPDFLHAQHDFEIRAIARIRDQVESLGVKLFFPNTQTIEDCVDKMRSYSIWEKAGVPTPKTRLLRDVNDLEQAFKTLGPDVWIRATEGGGGTGALPTDNFEFARLWIDRYDGWGHFTASERLSSDTVTWLSIWFHGELVVAQTRKRRTWNFGNRTLSGVTGITGVGETCSSPDVDSIAQHAIHAVDKRPHGIYGVDMTYDWNGRPNVTEINIGRFFTTHYFFTSAGLNMPDIYCRLALFGEAPVPEKKINPLPDGLVWIRGMDVEPVLTTAEELGALERQPVGAL